MTDLIVGIDPGTNGALATLDSDGWLEVYDLKDCIKPTGSFNSLDPALLNDLVEQAFNYYSRNVEIYCEESQIVHGNGIKTSRPIFDSRGVLRSVLALCGLDINYVQPKAWKKYFGLLKKNKSESVKKACELFPNQKDLFMRPKKGGGVKLLDGRAEAALIAYYGSEIT